MTTFGENLLYKNGDQLNQRKFGYLLLQIGMDRALTILSDIVSENISLEVADDYLLTLLENLKKTHSDYKNRHEGERDG